MSKINISLHIEGQVEPSVLASFLSAMGGDAAVVEQAKPSTKAKDKPAADPTPDKVAAKVEDKQPETDSGEDALRAEALQGLQAVNKANGADAVKAVLAEFGVKNISAVPAESLQALIDKCKEQTQ